MAFLLPLIPSLVAGGLGAASKLTQPKQQNKFDKLPTLSEGQQSLQDMIINLLSGKGGQQQGGLGLIQSLLSGSPESTAAFEAPHMRQFQEQTVPALAERFAGLGAGSQSSSAFQQALGQAGAGLQENLASIRSGAQLSGLQSLLSLLGPAFQSSFDYVRRPQKTSALSEGLGGFASGIAGGAGQLTPGLASKYWGI